MFIKIVIYFSYYFVKKINKIQIKILELEVFYTKKMIKCILLKLFRFTIVMSNDVIPIEQ